MTASLAQSQYRRNLLLRQNGRACGPYRTPRGLSSGSSRLGWMIRQLSGRNGIGVPRFATYFTQTGANAGLIAAAEGHLWMKARVRGLSVDVRRTFINARYPTLPTPFSIKTACERVTRLLVRKSPAKSVGQ